MRKLLFLIVIFADTDENKDNYFYTFLLLLYGLDMLFYILVYLFIYYQYLIDKCPFSYNEGMNFALMYI